MPYPKPHRRRPGRNSRRMLRKSVKDAYERRFHNTVKGSEWFADEYGAPTAVTRVGRLKDDVPAHQNPQDLPKSHRRLVPRIWKRLANPTEPPVSPARQDRLCSTRSTAKPSRQVFRPSPLLALPPSTLPIIQRKIHHPTLRSRPDLFTDNVIVQNVLKGEKRLYTVGVDGGFIIKIPAKNHE